MMVVHAKNVVEDPWFSSEGCPLPYPFSSSLGNARAIHPKEDDALLIPVRWLLRPRRKWGLPAQECGERATPRRCRALKRRKRPEHLGTDGTLRVERGRCPVVCMPVRLCFRTCARVLRFVRADVHMKKSNQRCCKDASE